MTIKKIGVGSDHAGVNLKNKIAEFLKEKGYEVTDYGTNSTASCDYPVYAKAVSKSVANRKRHYLLRFWYRCFNSSKQS